MVRARRWNWLPGAMDSKERPLLLDEPTRRYAGGTSQERIAGFLAGSIFSMCYVAAPTYIIASIVCLLRFPFWATSWMLLVPMVVSMAIPCFSMEKIGPRVLGSWAFSCIPKYFEYEEYHEITDEEIIKAYGEGKRFIFCAHPHGVFSFVGVCAAVSAVISPNGLYSQSAFRVPTAAASVIGMTPILRTVLGVFGFIDASNAVLTKFLLSGAGSLLIYVGGIVELFSSSPKREAVYLRKRKGFVKLALKTGTDLVPVYMFGNTTVLSVLTNWPLPAISRTAGVTLTFFWGRFGLPMPKKVRLTYARGRPLGLPHITNPTQEDVDKWHAEYCKQLVALFDKYKGSNSDYKHKTLVIE